jgi:hypothetical protein
MESYWTMRDGTHILMTDMTDNHLINSFYLLLRNGDIWKEEDSLNCMVGGGSDMADYYAGLDSRHISEMETIQYLREKSPLFLELEKEIRKRKIKLDPSIRIYEAALYDRFTGRNIEGVELFYLNGHPDGTLDEFKRTAQIYANTQNVEVLGYHTDYEEISIREIFNFKPENN